MLPSIPVSSKYQRTSQLISISKCPRLGFGEHSNPSPYPPDFREHPNPSYILLAPPQLRRQPNPSLHSPRHKGHLKPIPYQFPSLENVPSHPQPQGHPTPGSTLRGSVRLSPFSPGTLSNDCITQQPAAVQLLGPGDVAGLQPSSRDVLQISDVHEGTMEVVKLKDAGQQKEAWDEGAGEELGDAELLQTQVTQPGREGMLWSAWGHLHPLCYARVS